MRGGKIMTGLALTAASVLLASAPAAAQDQAAPAKPATKDARSDAHRRSQFAVIDPVYSATQVAPPPDRKAGAPWLYGDGELETWRLHLMRQRSRAVCRHVGYPGEFHEPSAHAFFRRTLPAGQNGPQELRLTAVGAVTVSLNGTTLLKAAAQAQPHTVKLTPVPGADRATGRD